MSDNKFSIQVQFISDIISFMVIILEFCQIYCIVYYIDFFPRIHKISSLLATLDKYIHTDLNTLTMLKAANSFKLFGDEKMRSCMLYGKFDDSTGVSYWDADQKSVNKSLDELGIPYIKDKEEARVEEEAPQEHLQPKDREQIYREKNSKKK